MEQARQDTGRGSIYAEVTARVIGELEQGRLPWVQPWDSAACECTMPQNGLTKRSSSGINVLILWSAVIRRGYSSQRWLTFWQALQLGGHVAKARRAPPFAMPTASRRRASKSGREMRIGRRGRLPS